MSSKAENTSHNFHQQHRLMIFFRNPVLLKIVAWLGSLSFLGSTGIVWADLKPISASQTEAQTLVKASESARAAGVKLKDREVFGPHFPADWRPSSVTTTAHVTAEELPNREIPIAVSPAPDAPRSTSKVTRLQHADILAAENYTVGVNGSQPNRMLPTTSVSIPGSSSNQTTISRPHREVVASTRSQVQSSDAKSYSAISKSVPTTGFNAAQGHLASVPNVPTLQVPKSLLKQFSRSGTNIPAPVVIARTGIGQRSLSGLKPLVVTPMKPAIKVPVKLSQPQVKVAPDLTLDSYLSPSVTSIEIPVPPPRTQIMKVQPVAHLPQLTTGKSVPSIPAIPTVRPAAAIKYSKPVAFVNNGNEQSYELIYPLSSPAPITSSFGWRTHPITGSRRFHSGLDIGAPMGAPVVAAGSGTIVSAGWLGGYGKAIVIQHNGIQQTLYGHLSEVFVQAGQRIEQGTVIGRVGSTGNSTGPHLHYEARMATADGWVAVDPADDVKYALDNLRQAMPISQRDLPPGIN